MHTKNKIAINFLAAMIFIVAGMVLLGWCIGKPEFASFKYGVKVMSPITAISFFLIACWLFIKSSIIVSKTNIIAQYILAFAILLSGILKILNYLGIVQLKLDDLFFPSAIRVAITDSQVAPNTALLFVFTGIAMLNLSGSKKKYKLLHDGVLIALFIISYLGIVGYIFGLEPFYRIDPFAPMALNTAVCFILAVFGMFISFPEGNCYKLVFSNNAGGRLARFAYPLIIIIPPVFGYFQLILQRSNIYTNEYAVAIDTAIIVLLVFVLIYYYAKALNRNDSARKMAVEDVIKNEEKYKTLVYALTEGIVYFNREGQIAFYNESFSKLTGYDQQELIYKDFADVFASPEDRPAFNKRLEDRKKGIEESYEAKILHRDGTAINVYISGHVIKEHGIPVAAFATLVDITEYKKRAEDIEAYSASAAHDLNSPLAKVEGVLNYILEYTKENLNEEQIELLEASNKTLKDSRVMLKDLLLFSKSGSDKIKKDPVDMQQIVNDTVASLQYQNPKATIIVKPLPVAYGDASAISHIWSNLISNALKYASKKDQPFVEIGATETGGKTTWYVKDNGAGFDMSKAENLFKPFKRLHSDFEGNGLGLPIAKRIVEKHGGKIWAEGKVNEGATFYFTL